MALAIAVAAVVAGCGRGGRVAAPKPPEGAPPTAQQETQTPPEEKPAAQAQAAQPPPPPRDAMPSLTVVQKGVTLRWTEKNKTSMNAKASKFEGSEVTRQGVLLDFSAELYENGKLTTTMTAPKVVVDADKRIVTATGGVVLKSVTRDTVVKSEWAKWYSRQNKIVGNGGVTWSSDMGNGGRFEGQAAAFEADTALRTVTARATAKELLPE